MKIAIIEDEVLMAEDLAESITGVEPKAEIITMLSSVKEAIAWFQTNEIPDLIFSDIQLGDGLSFAIFDSIPILAPVIFCTAYDEYALKAFKVNGIDYILKPFSRKTIAGAIAKYNGLKNNFSKKNAEYHIISQLFQQRAQNDISVLVHFREKISPVKISDIAFFYVDNDITHLVTFNRESHCINKPLEEMEKLAGDSFYRANRKFLVNRKAVKDASQYFNRKLLVNLTIPSGLDEPITVSKVKANHFLNWLSGI